MYEKGQPRLTRAQIRSHETTSFGIPQHSSHRSSLSASGALMSTHRAIIQASYRTLRPSAQCRSPSAAASGHILQSAISVPKKAPSLCMPGHPSRDIPGSYHLPYNGQQGMRVASFTMVAAQPYGKSQHTNRKAAAPDAPVLRRPKEEGSAVTATARQDVLPKPPARRTSASGIQHLQPPAWPSARLEYKSALALKRMPSFTSVGEGVVPSHHACRVGTSAGAVPSEAQPARPCSSRPAAQDSIMPCTPSGQVLPASPEKLRRPRAYCASARSRHLQQYLESSSAPTPSGQRTPTGGRDRSALPETEAARGAAANAERMQGLGRQPSSPQLRSAFVDMLPDDPLTAAGLGDRLGASYAVTAAAAAQRRPSTVPNMRSRLPACASGHDAVRPGTSAGGPCPATTSACIGPWSAEPALGCFDADTGSGVDKSNADKAREKSAVGQQDDGLGPQYAGWIWGPGSASCLQNSRKDANRHLEKTSVRKGPWDKSISSMDSSAEGKSKTECGDDVEAEDCYMLTCESVEVNAMLMSQLSRAGDTKL